MSSEAKAKRRARRVSGRAREGRFQQVPRLEIRADESTLTPFGGSVVVGELVRRIELIPALDAAIETAPRIAGLGPVKRRARGCSPGEALVAVAESMLCGGDSMLDLERLRADGAGAQLRAVPATPRPRRPASWRGGSAGRICGPRKRRSPSAPTLSMGSFAVAWMRR